MRMSFSFPIHRPLIYYTTSLTWVNRYYIIIHGLQITIVNTRLTRSKTIVFF